MINPLPAKWEFRTAMVSLVLFVRFPLCDQPLFPLFNDNIGDDAGHALPSLSPMILACYILAANASLGSDTLADTRLSFMDWPGKLN